MKVICISENWGNNEFGKYIPPPAVPLIYTVTETRSDFGDGKTYYRLAEYAGPFTIPGFTHVVTIYFLSDNFAPIQESDVEDHVEKPEPAMTPA
jgi:hypothetical protein